MMRSLGTRTSPCTAMGSRFTASSAPSLDMRNTTKIATEFGECRDHVVSRRGCYPGSSLESVQSTWHGMAGLESTTVVHVVHSFSLCASKTAQPQLDIIAHVLLPWRLLGNLQRMEISPTARALLPDSRRRCEIARILQRPKNSGERVQGQQHP